MIAGGEIQKMNIVKLAKAARVSTATVSRVINNPELVSKETREKVERVIAELNYVPNQQARSLRSRQTKMIAIIVPHTADYLFSYPYFSILLREASLELNRFDYNLVLTTDEAQKSPTETYKAFVDRRMVDGFILLDLRSNDERVDYLSDQDVPFVTIGRNDDDKDASYVDTDNDLGGYLAGKHLSEMHCKKILFINGPDDQSVSMWRERGFVTAAEAYGFDYEVFNGSFVEDSGVSITRANLGKFDGIFAASDLMAIGALKVLRDEGIMVPVVGFDNIPLSAEFSPKLTTVHQPIDEVGREVARSLAKLISKGEISRTIFPVNLVVRESSEVKR